MFYIIVIHKDDDQVVVKSSGLAREFKKEKQARHFIEGRPCLRMAETRIVSDITFVTKSITVDI